MPDYIYVSNCTAMRRGCFFMSKSRPVFANNKALLKKKGIKMRKKRRKTLKTWTAACRNQYKAARAALAGLICLYYASCPVYATNAVIKKVNNIYTLVVGIIGAAGGIVLAWGVFEFAAAYQSHDSSTQTQALKKVVSGIIMCAASTIIGLLK